MARIRTGKPIGRPPLARKDREDTVDTHLIMPVDVIEKIDRLRQGNESRKDVLVRLVREAPE
jgi:hypothetical protein